MQNEDTGPATRKLSVTFERKLGYDDYGNAVARAWIEDDIPADASDGDASQRAVEMLNVVKVAVFDTLGVECFMDEDSGVIREKHSPTVSVKQAADKVGTGFKGTTTEEDSGSSGGYNTGGLRVMNPNQLTEDIPKYIIDKCNEKGITAVWANNGKFGPFYREAVKQGESPKIPDPNDPSKAAIIKSDS